MERMPVQGSSNVISIGFDPETDTLEVEYKKGVYQYRNVSHAMWTDLLRAPSKGGWIGQHLKAAPQNYPYSRVS